MDNLELIEGGAALVLDQNVLVVADMHLGCEAALEYQGISLPRVQTKKILSYMEDVVCAIGPDKVMVAGDLKHNFSRNLIQEWNDVSRFVGALSGLVQLEVLKGNHDNYLASILSGFGVPLKKAVMVGRTRILHGHIGRGSKSPTIIGHIHPSIRLKDGVGASVKDHCFLYSDEEGMLVLPALSLVASGLDVVHHADSDTSSPLLPSSGLAGFKPVVFSGRAPLVSPSVGELRQMV